MNPQGVTRLIAGVPVRPYKYPRDEKQYYADPSEPIDRWYQAAFSSNARTIKNIVLDIFGGTPGCLIDPFCGAGSTAVAARQLGIPFLGVELDPILVEITTLKSWLAVTDISDLDKYMRIALTPAQLRRGDFRKIPRCVLGFCLAALLSGRSRTAMLDLVQADLAESADPITSSAILCGNSGSAKSWGPPHDWEKAAMFTSPPFPSGAHVDATVGPTASEKEVDRIRKTLTSALPHAERPEEVSKRRSPEEVVVSALRGAREVNGSYLAIIEYQDRSADLRALSALVGLLKQLHGIVVHEVLSTQDFSGLGTLFELVVESTPVTGLTMKYVNLTAIEREGLEQKINLADGHARQSLMPESRRAALVRLGDALSSGSISIPSSERAFREAFSWRLNTSFNSRNSFISYSASVSVDLIAKLVGARNATVHAVTPTFDNLAKLFMLNKVPTHPVPEEMIYPEPDFSSLDLLPVKVLFLVVPNNPTGACLSFSAILKIFDWAADRKVMVVLDMSFRFLIPDLHQDFVSEANSRGVSLAVIDDTGKVLPFFDSKLSIVSCSSDLTEELRLVHEDMLLNTSGLEMSMLTLFLGQADGFPDELERLSNLVRRNRQEVHATLTSCGITPWMRAEERISVEWIELGSDATEMVRTCARMGLQLLPGHLFDWHDRPSGRGTRFVRVALMRDPEVVSAGCVVLRSALELRTKGQA